MISNKEHQCIEWKESWRDEYLKWICGYANAYGGRLDVGKRDDGSLKHTDAAELRKLLEDVPNKITNAMGIIADVNLCEENGEEFLEIVVEKYPNLISLRGKYYYRSGSTMHEITGKELDRALLKSQGKTWDSMPIPKLKAADLDSSAIRYFITKAIQRGRLSEDDANVSTEDLFEKHPSKPYNPKLAGIFFRGGLIEAWGRGFDKIKKACQENHCPLPEYTINEDGILR